MAKFKGSRIKKALGMMMVMAVMMAESGDDDVWSEGVAIT